MLYFDKLGHLISDTSLDELHDFAINWLGFRRSWFQKENTSHPHYDLKTENAKHRAAEAGAMEIPAKVLSQKLKAAPFNNYY